MDRKAQAKSFKLFSMDKYGKLPTTFQLKIFAFQIQEDKPPNLLKSLKQNVEKLAQVRNVPKQPSFTGDLVFHA